ncbi:hypothetical protein [Roseobacter sp. N2S]|uniref:hypothetical protein n=1 Tax=Roseobacter sp. N2S TaxID=2663844 RepID=UPI002866ECA8|nr:hypothetical protein [Roseobacter sp. N2S]MDR6266551.1 hypothetical protein [Roseobacter sp. N2S]
MTNKPTLAEIEAREMAAAVDEQMAGGQQMSFLPEAQGVQVPDGVRKPGRPEGAKNKGSSQMRDFLAAQGMSMPELRLAEIAGLNSRDDVVIWAMKRANQLLDWMADGSTVRVMTKKATKKEMAKFEDQPWVPSAKDKGDAFRLFYAQAMTAASAVLPYVGAKASPDVTQNVNVTQVVMPGAQPAQDRADPRVIDGSARPVGGPPPLPKETQQNQVVSNSSEDHSDNESRTK